MWFVFIAPLYSFKDLKEQMYGHIAQINSDGCTRLDISIERRSNSRRNYHSLLVNNHDIIWLFFTGGLTPLTNVHFTLFSLLYLGFPFDLL